VRGASSLSLQNDPLIYVDGIRVDNAQASGPTNQGFGSQSVSRWNDFDPDDIESLEIIKGPAAATLYGTEASNGVIQIITKKGAAGRATWNLTTRQGANWFNDWQDRLFVNYGAIPRPGGGSARDTVTISPRQLNDSLRATFGEDIFRTGRLQDYQLNLSGGSTAFRYYVGGGYEENQGVERVNGLRRSNLRANVQATPGERYDVQASLGYTSGRTNIPLEAGGGGATWGTYFSSPGFLYTGTNPGNPQLGFRSGPPDIYYNVYRIFQDADRFTGSVQLAHRPFGWLNHRLIVGVDRLMEDNQEIVPRNDVLGTRYASFAVAGPTVGGYLAIGTRDATNSTFDYVANATLGLGRSLKSVTSVGGQYYGRRTIFRDFYGENFPAAGLVALNAAAVQRLQRDDIIENNTVGGFVQEQLIWNDRLFVTGAVRADDNSAFGTNFDVVTYPKVSASYVLSEEPSIPLPSLVNSLRLRAAYGASGLQPGAFDAIRTYVSGGGVVTPQSAGNRDLGPEASYELELGLDAGFADDRASIDLTYFNGYTRDAILSRQAPPSEGFPGLQFFNAGRVNRNGLELLLRGHPIRSERVGLELTASGSTNNYEIVDLGAGTNLISVTGQVQHVVGYAPGAWWDRRVVSADRNAAGQATNLRCDDGQGGQVACASAPRVFLGNTVPTREGSLSATLTLLRDLRLTAFFDYRGGYKKLDGNRRARCNLFSLCRENYFPQEFDAVTLAEVQGGTAFTYNLIQDASFTRFRELSLNYSLPAGLVRRAGVSRAAITVAGRNLGLWTNYGGLEPEASFNGGTRGGFGQWEQNVLPQTRQFVATLNLSF
jgi:TonB-dependent SusC/RagA subfamily outer membrane receptor